MHTRYPPISAIRSGIGFMESTLEEQRAMVEALRDPTLFGLSPETPVGLIETHISWVLLAGERAYKVKKAIDLGFLNYSTLELRRLCCEEELRLNRRSAPELYLEVCAIAGNPVQPRPGGEGPPMEYAVVMRRFQQEALLDRQLTEGHLDQTVIDAAAESIASFHGQVAVASPDSPYGEPRALLAPMLQNFQQLRELVEEPALRARIDHHEAWCCARFAALQQRLEGRRRGGFIRECHGDLHLGNLALLAGRVVPFDAIEFNPQLRWIDTMNEVAFLAMDLEERGRPDLARRFVNRYLERSGDYQGVPLLRFYQHYRAMVRAKVSAIRLGQPGISQGERLDLIQRVGGYFTLAEEYTRPSRPLLLITCGLSGSGKSHLTAPLLERLGAIRLRSDLERKRLYGLKPEMESRSTLEGGIYTADATEATYRRMAQLAGEMLEGGQSVIVDATFLRSSRREEFAAIAKERRLPFAVLLVTADPSLLESRIVSRLKRGDDPSEATLAVLEGQLAQFEPPGASERGYVINVDGGHPPSPEMLEELIRCATGVQG